MRCLEQVLTETLYADWLRAQPRGVQRAANVAGFLRLAQQFDQFQRQGLFRFLKFIEAQQEAEAEPEVPAAATENAVRLMSIHQSKGLEFPVVVLADLTKQFNEQDLHGDIIFDEEFGLCPKVKPPHTGRRYPSLPHWLAQRHRQKREMRGEELRLLYVALTRAREYLILTSSIPEKYWDEKWMKPQPVSVQKIASAKCFADWLALVVRSDAAPSSRHIKRNEPAGALPLLSSSGGLWRTRSLRRKKRKAESGKRNRNCLNSTMKLCKGFKKRCRGNTNSARQQRARPNRPSRRCDGRRWMNWTTRRSKFSIFSFQGTIDPSEYFRPKNGRKAESRRLSAADAGTAHHKFLQHLSLENAGGNWTTLEAEAGPIDAGKIFDGGRTGGFGFEGGGGVFKFRCGTTDSEAGGKCEA